MEGGTAGITLHPAVRSDQKGPFRFRQVASEGTTALLPLVRLLQQERQPRTGLAPQSHPRLLAVMWPVVDNNSSTTRLSNRKNGAQVTHDGIMNDGEKATNGRRHGLAEKVGVGVPRFNNSISVPRNLVERGAAVNGRLPRLDTDLRAPETLV